MNLLIHSSHIELTERRIISVLRVELALTAFAVLLDLPYLRQILGLIALFVIPGFLVIRLLDIVVEDPAELVILSLGLSTTFLMFAGLILNQLFVLIRLPDPLTIHLLLPIFVTSLAIASEILRRRTGRVWRIPSVLSFSPLSWIVLLLTTISPFLATLGAFRLNNGGGSEIAIASLLLIATIVLIETFFYRRLSPHVLPYSLYLIGLSMLLSFSLRSQHISGWDINQEYFAYQLTEADHEWQFKDFRDPYNASLSITVLPTVINAFLDINSEYVFKLVYQLLFAFVPVAIFLLVRRYVSHLLGFLAGVFFVFQPWFIQPMPALTRQQTGLLFFALLLWVLFTRRLSELQRDALLVAFGASLVVSHYSTTYIALGIFTVTYLVSVVVRAVASRAGPRHLARSIPGWMLAFLYAATLYWTAVQTQIGGGIGYIAQITLINVRNAFASDLRSEDVWQTFQLFEKQFDIEDVNEYVRERSEEYAGDEGLYPKVAYEDFTPVIARSAELSGSLAEGALKSIVSAVFALSRQLTKVLTMIGSVVLLIGIAMSRGRVHENALQARGFPHEFVLMNLVSLLGLVIFLMLPVVSLYYNSFRLFMQVLVISSVSMLIAANSVLSVIRSTPVREKVIGLLLVVFFTQSSGLSSFLVGGTATMNLNNFGDPYDKFYTLENEVYAAEWLSSVVGEDTRVFADETAVLRLISFGRGIMNTEDAVLPSTIARDSYVFMDHANLRFGIAHATQDGIQISYGYPFEFLNEHKDLIYDNGGAQIFR